MKAEEKGIRVNCGAPGPVWTPLVPATRTPDEVAQHRASALWKRPAQQAKIAGEGFAPTGFKMTSR